MTPTGWFILTFVAFDLLIAIVIVRSITKSMFGKFAEAYPQRSPGDVHIRRRAQSFSIGLLNFGFSVRVALDDEHVHMSPEPWARWTGMPEMSIPISEFRPAGSARSGIMPHLFRIETKSASEELRGPGWLWRELSEDD